ncbi:uncharacterized protein LOC120924767 [Rana temporaria]|uniref:uncharacterized protein LOC120924767 n=1 Tax=Rana temporaria TaxID=8407 RepID=UPI001AAD2F76|nr:uncharacterized protein LOC120924767 [Rana temporaria]
MNPAIYLSLLYFLHSAAGAVGNFTISGAQTDVTGYEKGSILLSVSYHMVKRVNWFQIRWNRFNQTVEGHLLICTIRDDGFGKKTITLFPSDGYEKRMRVVPENGSLIIQHLKMEDSGTYRVYMMDNNQTESFDINVTVKDGQTQGLENAFTMDKAPSLEGQLTCSCNNSGVDVPTTAWIIFSSRLSSVLITMLVFLTLHIRGRKAQRQRMMSRLYKYR